MLRNHIPCRWLGRRVHRRGLVHFIVVVDVVDAPTGALAMRSLSADRQSTWSCAVVVR